MFIKDLKDFLDEKSLAYENPNFLEKDPIKIPHLFKKKEDIEISGFLVASISWGNRLTIIKNGIRMMELMGNDPYNFVIHHKKRDLIPLSSFIHRTFNGYDFIYFIKALRHIYIKYGGLEKAFSKFPKSSRMDENIYHFRKCFFELSHDKRVKKHVSNPLNGSAAKRINMYLRWMVRSSKNKVDFGIWKKLNSNQLSCPLDIHTGNIARKLGLLNRKINDLKALKELDKILRSFDASDPVKYDFALFGLGVYEGFNNKDMILNNKIR